MSEWINVKDRLPEKAGYYLVVRKLVYRAIHPIAIRLFDEHTTGSRKRFWTNGGEDMNITHWQPLPEPPKE